MSMISTSGAIRFMTPWHVPTKSSRSPKSVRNVMKRTATAREPNPPLRGRRRRVRRRPACGRGRGCLRADRDRRDVQLEGGKRVGGGRRRQEYEIALWRWVRPQPPGPVDGAKVCSELGDDQAACLLGTDEEDTAGRTGELGDERVL